MLKNAKGKLFNAFSKPKVLREVGFLAKELVGKVTHYYDKIQVAVIELSGRLKEGDLISIEKEGQAFEQKASSMQVEHKAVKEAKKGSAIGMKVMQEVRPGFEVYKIID